MTIKFPDLSHYKPHEDVSKWPALITKATEGTGYTDPTYASYKQAAGKAGIPFAGYHFLTTADAKAQAKHAYAHIGKTPAMLDVESGTSGSPSLKLTLAFIDAYRDLGGVMYLIYVPKWYWFGNWHSPSLKPLVDRGMALISSQYPHEGYTADGPGWDSYGGMKPSIWQYTSTPIDTNAFKGTQAALGDLFRYGPNGKPVPPAPDLGDDEMMKDDWAKLSDLIDDRIKAALPTIASAVAHSPQYGATVNDKTITLSGKLVEIANAVKP